VRRGAHILATCVALVAGCGYSVGPLTRSDVTSVYVPIFENRTFRREIEVQLAEALKTEIASRAHFRLAAVRTADSILTGEIVGFKERVLAEDAASDVFSKRVRVFADFDWKEQRTGRVLASGRRLSQPADLIVARGETVATATAESFADLARAIVDAMEEAW